ncbi:MAG: fatty acid desaturase [Candidatus Puniceispirillaceae bacterium]
MTGNTAPHKWKRIKIDAALLRQLTQREDRRPMRDMSIWLGLMAFFAYVTNYLWGSWWAALPLYAYAVLYSTGSQSREHETGHGTAFKTKKYNQFFFEITSFMVLRETFLRIKSHDIHHQHTILTDKDPEIVTPVPPNFRALLLNLFMVERAIRGMTELTTHSLNRLTAKDRQSGRVALPDGAVAKARLWIAILAGTAGLSLYLSSWLPVLLIGPLPMMFGGSLRHLFALSQHVGLAQNVYDHRMNTRTIYLGPILGFLYMNMQYHLEHHLYPNVPYYHLPALHEAIKDKCPPAYNGLWPVFAEMLPVLWRQRIDPAYHIDRPVPA